MMISREIKKGVALGLLGIGFFLFDVSAAETFDLFDHTSESSEKAIEVAFSAPVIVDPQVSQQLSSLRFITIPVLPCFQTSRLKSDPPLLLDDSPPQTKPPLFQFFSILRL